MLNQASRLQTANWRKTAMASLLLESARFAVVPAKHLLAAKEGEYITASWMSTAQTSVKPTECCAGLTAYKNSCNEKAVNGVCTRNQYTVMCGSYLCVNCGDGQCNSAAGENACNCAADCGETTVTCDAQCKADGHKSGLCKTWSGTGEIGYGSSYCSGAAEICYCQLKSAFSDYPICNKNLSGSPIAEEIAQCAAAKGAIYCGNGWCKCANCGFVEPTTATPANPGKIVCTRGLNTDQCKSAGGVHTCPGTTTISSLGRAIISYTGGCYCSCP